MTTENRTIKNWAHRLSGEGETLTLAEAHLLASIAATDRLLECVTALQDVQMRLTRIEMWMEATLPQYGPVTRSAARALVPPS